MDDSNVKFLYPAVVGFYNKLKTYQFGSHSIYRYISMRKICFQSAFIQLQFDFINNKLILAIMM